jgi:DNA-binding NarL/FixJ family response regulator
MIKQIRVLIASNDSCFQSNLGKYLANQQDIQIISQVDSFQVLSIAQALQADILLLDAHLAHSWGTEVLLDVQVKNPEIKALFSSHTFSNAFITEALQYGAKGFILKSCPLEAYAKAIRLIHNGELWITRRTLTHILEGLLAKEASSQELPSSTEANLTPREKEIMAWIAKGLTNKEIAKELGISDKTIKAHLSHIFNKLKVHRRMQLLLHRSIHTQH